MHNLVFRTLFLQNFDYLEWCVFILSLIRRNKYVWGCFIILLTFTRLFIKTFDWYHRLKLLIFLFFLVKSRYFKWFLCQFTEVILVGYKFRMIMNFNNFRKFQTFFLFHHQFVHRDFRLESQHKYRQVIDKYKAY